LPVFANTRDAHYRNGHCRRSPPRPALRPDNLLPTVLRRLPRLSETFVPASDAAPVPAIGPQPIQRGLCSRAGGCTPASRGGGCGVTRHLSPRFWRGLIVNGRERHPLAPRRAPPLGRGMGSCPLTTRPRTWTCTLPFESTTCSQTVGDAVASRRGRPGRGGRGADRR
jgi:hypothetical protein